MLPAEGTVGELHVVGSLDVRVGEGELFVIPGEVAVFVAGAKVDDFGFGFGVFEGLPDEDVVAVAFVDDGDWLGQFFFGVPAEWRGVYPVSMSGRRE